jgi:hypothetical protein
VIQVGAFQAQGPIPFPEKEVPRRKLLRALGAFGVAQDIDTTNSGGRLSFSWSLCPLFSVNSGDM